MVCSNLVKDLDQPKVISLTIHFVPGVVCLSHPSLQVVFVWGQHILLLHYWGVLGMYLVVQIGMLTLLIMNMVNNASIFTSWDRHKYTEVSYIV